MVDVMMTMESFLLCLAFGLSLFVPLVNSELTGVGFVKLITIVALVSLSLATALNLTYASPLSYPALLQYTAILLLLVPTLFHQDKKSILMWAIYIIRNAVLFLLVAYLHNRDLNFFLYFISSILFLGVVNYSMLLGHYYLVVPKLTEKPLVLATYILWLILAVKIVQSSIFISNNYDFFTLGTNKGAGYTFNWVMLLMRVGWGYLIIGIMSFFNWKLVKIRSIQSATGMLYAMTFFIIIGELCAHYLFYAYGMLL